MGTVVVLITLLVGLLSGLTAGLARDNTVALTSLPADRLAFAPPPDGQEVSFTNSSVGESSWRAWAEQPGVRSAAPIGIRTVNGWAGDRTVAVAAFGVEPSARIAPASAELGPGKVVLSAQAAEDLDVGVGDAVRLGQTEERVAAVEGGAMYSHQPVVWTSLDDWQRLGRSGASAQKQATVVALTGSADWAAGGRGDRNAVGAPGRLPGRTRLLPGGERLPPAHARFPLRHLGARRRGLLHRLDDPAQR
ncbi:hypothetical protein GCM10018987_04270 [Streptomyces cremeus]